MSVKSKTVRTACAPRRSATVLTLGLTLSLLPVLALSVDLTSVPNIPDVLDDPLDTRPPVLEQGAVLPGDRQSIVCPVEKDFTAPLLLDEAVDLALCHHPQAQAAWAELKIQAANLGVAKAGYWPTLNGAVNHLNSYYQFPGSNAPSSETDGFTLYGNLNWRLFDFGGRSANLAAANWLLTQALANQDAVFQRILDGVIQAYFDVQTAHAQWRAKAENEALAGQTLTSARRREANGASGRSDTLQAETVLAKAALSRSRADGDYRKALAVLRQAMGIAPETALTLPENAESEQTGETLAQDGRDLQTWLIEAKRRHPAIVAAQALWEAAKQRIVQARSEGLPTLDFNLNAYQNGYPNQALSQNQTRVETIGINLTIPLFEGFARTYKIRGAQAQAEQRAAELADTERQTLLDVVKAHAEAEAALRNLSYSATWLDSAQAAVDSSQRRYDKGAADILELLNTQTSLADARQERLRTLADWRAARLRLFTSSGVLGRDMIGQAEGQAESGRPAIGAP
ncbi:TolC family protein [Methylomonas koyamae]|uniref:TolC family protein n=1 Tax=Methylomonas koyamae TaxID=702114 RepID=UPI002872EC76|nr:TolC family protein [Methylomonas koyamae]WNB74012.1 TolC family protein [Methylomonas koyamae]